MVHMPKDCEVDKEYIFNNRFKCLKGHEWFVNGEVVFPEGPSETHGIPHDSAMRYNIGWNFANAGVIYRNSDVNFAKCMRRHTCVREPKVEILKPGEDSRLREVQQIVVSLKARAIKNAFVQAFGFVEWPLDMRDAAEWLALIPHIKHELRVQALQEIKDNGTISLSLWMKSCLWKLKLGEIAKSGKYPRMIVDMGVAASLQGAYFAEVCKSIIKDKGIVFGDTEVIFCGTPSPENVSDHFGTLFECKHKRTILCFSDDACIAIRQEDGSIHYYNLDISSCDASQTRGVFDLMFFLFDAPKEYEEAIRKQVTANVRVTSHDGTRSVLLKPTEYYLQSGITVTTLVNVMAQYLMGAMFEENDATNEADIIKSARDCGYIITLARAHQKEDAQFLKMSPCRDVDGVWRTCLNLGVILRASGVTKQHLPGKDSWEIRCLRFQTALMDGLLAGISYPPLEALNPNYRDGKKTASLTGISGVLDRCNGKVGDKKIAFTRESIYARYRLTDNEIDEFETFIKELGVGMQCRCAAATKIIELDYGLGLPLLDRPDVVTEMSVNTPQDNRVKL